MGHELEDYCKENAEDQDYEPIIGEQLTSSKGTLDFMDTDPFTFQWVTQRKDCDIKFGISLNFDESNDLVEVADIYGESLAEEKNRRLSEIPGAYSYALQPGDIIEAVNSKTEIEEMQRELRTALSINIEVSRTRDYNAYDTRITTGPMWTQRR